MVWYRIVPVCALIATLAMQGCGGGGGGGTPAAAPTPALPTVASDTTLSGSVALGKPIAGATVDVRCAGSNALAASTVTSEEGLYQFRDTFPYPCLLLAHGGTVDGSPSNDRFVSAAYARGTANITPLTHLVVARLFGDDPLTVFQSFGNVTTTAAIATVTPTGLNSAQAFVEQRIIGRLGMTVVGAPSFTTTPFAAQRGDAMDGLLELYRSGLSINDLQAEQVLTASISGQGLAAGSLRGPCVPGVKTGFGGTFDDRPVYVPLEYGFSGGDGDGGSAGGGSGAGGGGSEGQFRNALVSAIRLDNDQPLGSSAVTDARTGMVSVVRCDYTGPLLVTVSGREGATYYDEALDRDVPFGPEQSIRAIVTDTDRNFGITAYTEAAVRYAVRTLPGRLGISLDPPVTRNAGAAAASPDGQPTTKDAADDRRVLTRIPAARLTDPSTDPRKLIGRVISDQLPGVFRGRSADGSTIVDLDITRLPVLLNAQNSRSGSGVLTDSPNGIYGSVLSGLARGSNAFRNDNGAPALAITQQLATDLSDGTLDLLVDGAPIASPSELTYSFESLWSNKTVGTGLTAEAIGTAPLARQITPLQYYVLTPLNLSPDTSRFWLTSDGVLTRRRTVPPGPTTSLGIDETRTLPPGVRFSRFVVGNSDLAALEQSGQRIWRLADSDPRGMAPIAMPAPTRNVTWMDVPVNSGLVFRLSDGRFYITNGIIRGASASFQISALDVPPGILSFETTRSTEDGAANDPAAPDLRSKLADPTRWGTMAYGLRSDGAVVKWRLGSAAVLRTMTLPPVRQLSNSGYAVYALTSDGSVYWVNRDQALVTADQNPPCVSGDGAFEAGYCAAPAGLGLYLLRFPAGGPVRIDGLPRICWLAGSYAIACDGDVHEIRMRIATSPLTVAPRGGIGPDSYVGTRRLPLPGPMWRAYSGKAFLTDVRFGDSRSEDPTFVSVDGRLFDRAGNPIEAPPLVPRN